VFDFDRAKKAAFLLAETGFLTLDVLKKYLGLLAFVCGAFGAKTELTDMSAGRPLLIKSFCLGTVDEALENNRTVFNSRERARCKGKIITNEIEICDSRLRKI
jgi:hypothetical protein